jgi:16S rRNA (cytosine967-C5)-methyltransferase
MGAAAKPRKAVKQRSLILPSNLSENSPMKPSLSTPAFIEGLSARQAATALLGAVVDNHLGLDSLLESDTSPAAWRALDNARDRALALAIVKSALRFRGTITALIFSMLEHPLPDNARNVRHILHVAIAQIMLLRVPESAAVNLAVEAANRDPQAKRYANLVNAVLRRLIREGDAAFEVAKAKSVEAPDWLFAMLVEDYGDFSAREILAGNRSEAPLDFTVKGEAELWATQLGGIALNDTTVRVAHGQTPVPELEGFSEGAWWVQDAAAALPAILFGYVLGQHILDMCAAPGGKTAQLAYAGANVTALDVSKNRLKRVAENMARLQLQAHVVVGDARKHVPETLYDGVLIDAPCTSTGTLRRHPDVAWTKTPDDVVQLARIQFELLEAAMRLTKPGGIIVYANCSLLKAEGEFLLKRWIASRKDVTVEAVTEQRDGGLAAYVDHDGFLRTTALSYTHENPLLSGMDGFFAARLRKTG